MDSSPKPIPVISDLIEGGKRNFTKSFELSMKKASQIRDNVARNVRTLTGNAATAEAAFAPAGNVTHQSLLTSAGLSTTNISAEVPGGVKRWSEGIVVDQQPWTTTSASSISLGASNSSSPPGPFSDGEIPSPHFDLSHVSATSVFDIGSIGTPVLGGSESIEIGKSDTEEKTWKPDPPPVILSSRSEDMLTQNSLQPPLLELDDVRKFVGNAIMISRKVRALGLPESSWENKMPWRHPQPSYLSKGLQWPPEEFSSEKEKHEYYRRARRRGRYLIGSIPTWSFIVADLALLYFLIDNPAGKFLLSWFRGRLLFDISVRKLKPSE